MTATHSPHSPFSRIAAALCLPEDAGEAEILRQIHQQNPTGDEVRDMLDGRIPGCTYDPTQETVTQILEEPVQIGAVSIDRLVYRRAKFRDIRIAGREDHGIDSVAVMAALLSGQSLDAVIDELCGVDQDIFAGYILPFCRKSRRRISTALDS